MKARVLSLLGVLALGAGTIVLAQDYDDIYYDGSKTATAGKTETRKVETVRTRSQAPAAYKVTVARNYQTDRDIDEYNRRGGIYDLSYNDTIYLDSLAYDDDAFANTQRIERFYNPDIVVSSNDADLLELYYDDAPTVNLIIGSNYGYTPRVGWGIGYGSYWYDPWYSFYDPFYDPYYSIGWYGWRRPYYSWYGWHAPFGWSWGWHSAWYGWHDPWMRPWGHHGPGLWSRGNIYHDTRGRYWDRGRHTNRLPGDGRSMLGGNGRRGTTTALGTRATAGRSGAGTINNGRVRPSSMTGRSGSGMATNRSRTSETVGNINRSTAGGGFSGGSVRNRGTSSGTTYGGSTSRGTSSSTRSGYGSSSSRSSSYGSSSRGSSYGGSSRSSSYSGSSYGGSSRGSSGGYSGGGSSRGSSGGSGGGRRH